MAGRQTSTGAVHRPARDDGVLAIRAGSELPRLQNTDWEDGCCGKSHLWGKYCKERYRPGLIRHACVGGHVTSRRWRPCEAAEIDSTDWARPISTRGPREPKTARKSVPEISVIPAGGSPDGCCVLGRVTARVPRPSVRTWKGRYYLEQQAFMARDRPLS
jgi:hypothetical protein